jgi:hypothetical protein
MPLRGAQVRPLSSSGGTYLGAEVNLAAGFLLGVLFRRIEAGGADRSALITEGITTSRVRGVTSRLTLIKLAEATSDNKYIQPWL